MPILEEFRNLDRGLRSGQKWQTFCKKNKWSTKKENVLQCNVKEEGGENDKTVQFPVQHPGIDYMRI